MRAISQTSSFEIDLIIIFLMLIILRERNSFLDFMKVYIWHGLMLSPLFLVFLVRVLTELNCRPIDFVEGES